MGIFADIKAFKSTSKIKSGGTAKLSISQITGLITNMLDAKKNLSPEEFNKVYALFKELRTCTTKIEMDMTGYLETVRKVILKFDKIVPYEKFSGGNEIEFSFMMDDIREIEFSSDEYDELQPIMDGVLNEEEQEYINIMIDGSKGIIDTEDANKFMVILKCYQEYGKTKALKEFDIIINKYIEEVEVMSAISKVSYMTGMLYPNGIVTEDESNKLSEKYLDLATSKLFK